MACWLIMGEPAKNLNLDESIEPSGAEFFNTYYFFDAY